MDVQPLAAARAVLDTRRLQLQHDIRICYINRKKQQRAYQMVYLQCMEIALTILAWTSPDTNCVAADLGGERQRRGAGRPSSSFG